MTEELQQRAEKAWLRDRSRKFEVMVPDDSDTHDGYIAGFTAAAKECEALIGLADNVIGAYQLAEAPSGGQGRGWDRVRAAVAAYLAARTPADPQEGTK